VLAAIVDVAGVGLPVMGLLIALESTGIPLPGETALIAASLVASQGKLDIAAVIVVAAAAAIIGDNCGYLLGRKGGRRLLQKPIFRGHGERLIDRGQPFFAKHGGKTVFLGRWFAGLRIAAAWLAGINHMHWPSFLMWNALGGVAWATSVGLLSYFLGRAAENAIKTVGIVGAGVTVGSGVAILLVMRARRRRREREGEDEMAPPVGSPEAPEG
jgi:membrane protein DedA with SNARE-associated domain